MTNIKSCLLCENCNTHPCKCEHCEDWDNFRISEDGKALREKIYGDGYQDGHRDGYDKGYDDAQANNSRPQGEWIMQRHDIDGCFYTCSNCGRMIRVPLFIDDPEDKETLADYPYCHCGAIMRNPDKE